MAKPPNLRLADSDQDCSDCRWFDPQRQICTQYNEWPVSPEMVCDSFSPSVEAQDESTG